MSDFQTGTVATKVPGPARPAAVVAVALDDLMIAAGPAGIVLGVRAERRGLEDTAKPLTAHDAEDSGGGRDFRPPRRRART